MRRPSARGSASFHDVRAAPGQPPHGQGSLAFGGAISSLKAVTCRCSRLQHLEVPVLILATPVSDAPDAVGTARSTKVRCCGTSGHRSSAA